MPNDYAAQARSADESYFPQGWRGLVAAYDTTLAHTGGELRDLSSYKNHATLQNMAPGSDWVMTERGLALDFDGTNDRLQIADSPQLQFSDELTIMVWLNQSSLSASRSILAKGQYGAPRSWEYALYTNNLSSNSIRFSVADGTGDTLGNNGYTSFGSWSAGSWRHVAVTFNGRGSGNAGKLKIFIDGVDLDLTFVGTLPTTISNSANPLYFGDLPGGGGSTWNGQMAGLKIYNRALSPAFIQEIYNLER